MAGVPATEADIAVFHHKMSKVQKKDACIPKMMLLLVLGVFLLCWVPYTVLSVIYQRTRHASVWLTILYRFSNFTQNQLWHESFDQPLEELYFQCFFKTSRLYSR